MTQLTHTNGHNHDDAERARLDEVARMFRDEMNSFVEDVRPKTWNDVLTYMLTFLSHLQRTKRLELEQRIEVLEERVGQSQFSFRGVWREGELYKRGDFTSVPACGIYHCDRDTMARPGSDGAGWVLVVKSGRDGKDGAPAELAQQRTVRTAERSQDSTVRRR